MCAFPRYLIGHARCVDIFSFRSVRSCGRYASTFRPDRNFTVRRETSTRLCASRHGNARERKRKKKKKERTRFPVTGGISCLTDRRDSETNDARLLRHDESHLGTAGRQTSRSIPKFVTRRGNSPPSSLIYCGLDD